MLFVESLFLLLLINLQTVLDFLSLLFILLFDLEVLSHLLLFNSSLMLSHLLNFLLFLHLDLVHTLFYFVWLWSTLLNLPFFVFFILPLLSFELFLLSAELIIVVKLEILQLSGLLSCLIDLLSGFNFFILKHTNSVSKMLNIFLDLHTDASSLIVSQIVALNVDYNILCLSPVRLGRWMIVFV